MSLELPFVLNDRYEVSQEIGRGGQSIVYRAEDRVLRREVAVKLLREDAVSEQTLVRFRQEMKVTAQLEHAHILHVYDTGTHAGLPFIVMELAPGLTLADRLDREKQLPIGDAIQIAREVGLALAHAHQRGIVHRDVKPDNILVGPGGALLADFGVARVTEQDLSLRITSTGTAVGTLLYMSPEQLCAEPNIDARADQYALACVLYEMLAGVRPHVATSFEGLRMLRMSGRHSPVSVHRSTVPPAVARALDIALSPVSADRFRNMNEFLTAIGAANSADFRVSEVAFPVQQAGIAGQGDSGTLRKRVTVLRWPGRRAALVLAVLAAVAIAGRSLATRDNTSPQAALTNDLVLAVDSLDVAPAIAGIDSIRMARISGALHEELRAWRGVQIAVGASRSRPAALIRPTLSAVNDSARLQLLVLVGSSGASHRIERFIPREAIDAPAQLMHDMTLEALAHVIDPSLSPGDAPGLARMPVRSIDVLRAYVGGFNALRNGRFAKASERFAAAASIAPAFAQARFWAGQSGAWSSPSDTSEWGKHAEAAVRLGNLGTVDSLLALGLRDLARADFPSSCAHYRAATTVMSNSFEAWYGLGECQRLDDLVLDGPRGLRFRSSHGSALRAYLRALPLASTAELLGALLPTVMRTTYADGTRTRRGRSAAEVKPLFASLASLDADTLAFFPLDQDAFATRPLPETWEAAVRRGQSVARRLTAEAVTRWPDAPSIWLQRALALELSGILAQSGRGDDAGTALERAAASTASPFTSAQIAVARTRVLLRRGHFVEAAAVARTAIAAPAIADAGTRRLLVPLAMLVDDIRRAERLFLPDTERDSDVPIDVADSVGAFTLRAQGGECRTLAKQRTSLDSTFAARFSRAEIGAQRTRLLPDPFLDAVPCLGVASSRDFTSPDVLYRMYRSIDEKNSRRFRALIDSLQQSRRGAVRSSITWDAVYREAWATVQAGDTASARAQLIEALDNIANMSRFTLDQPAQAAGLRRGVQLLVEIADPKAPEAARRRWTEMASALRPRE